MWTSSWACEQQMQQHDALSTHMHVSSSDRSAQDGWCTTADMQPKGSIKPHAMPYTAPNVAAARCVTWTPCTTGRMCHRHAKEGRSTLIHQHTIEQPARHLQHTARASATTIRHLAPTAWREHSKGRQQESSGSARGFVRSGCGAVQMHSTNMTPAHQQRLRCIYVATVGEAGTQPVMRAASMSIGCTKSSAALHDAHHFVRKAITQPARLLGPTTHRTPYLATCGQQKTPHVAS